MTANAKSVKNQDKTLSLSAAGLRHMDRALGRPTTADDFGVIAGPRHSTRTWMAYRGKERIVLFMRNRDAFRLFLRTLKLAIADAANVAERNALLSAAIISVEEKMDRAYAPVSILRAAEEVVNPTGGFYGGVVLGYEDPDDAVDELADVREDAALVARQMERERRIEEGLDPDDDPAWCDKCHRDVAFCRCPPEDDDWGGESEEV